MKAKRWLWWFIDLWGPRRKDASSVRTWLVGRAGKRHRRRSLTSWPTRRGASSCANTKFFTAAFTASRVIPKSQAEGFDLSLRSLWGRVKWQRAEVKDERKGVLRGGRDAFRVIEERILSLLVMQWWVEGQRARRRLQKWLEHGRRDWTLTSLDVGFVLFSPKQLVSFNKQTGELKLSGPF